MVLMGEMNFRALLPPPGSQEEPDWLRNLRRDGEDFTPNSQDQEALSSIPYFSFALEQLEFGFNARRRYVEDEEWGLDFDSQDDLMIAMEGLCWE